MPQAATSTHIHRITKNNPLLCRQNRELGGKILYKESDIERMLAANYREAFR